MAKRNKHRNRSVDLSAVTRERPRVVVPPGRKVSSPPLLYVPEKKRVLVPRSMARDSRKAAEAARLSVHLSRVAAIPSPAETQLHRSKLSLAPAMAEPDNRKSSHKAREALTCKKRPDSKRATRGKGGSKRFVPWCG